MEEKDFALRLAMLRTKKNVSAREMSLAIGQNSSYINHIETGKTLPSLSGILYICEYLNITPSEFFDTDIPNPEKLRSINELLKKLDDKQLDMVEKRLSAIRKATRKYGETVELVLQKKDEIKSKIKNLENSDEALEDLENRIIAVRAEAEKAASVLSEKRKDTSLVLNERISAVLYDLDMPKVRFKISIKKHIDSTGKTIFESRGFDDVEFLVSPNVGEDMLPISRIASGGELSRIMLAIKNTMISKSGEGTSVFDEIDAGVSGATSERIGRKLDEMSDTTQIICITHSAQIAALADTHLRISKSELDGRVESTMDVLDRQGRIAELSRIIGGINITEKQIKTATEMLDKACR